MAFGQCPKYTPYTPRTHVHHTSCLLPKMIIIYGWGISSEKYAVPILGPLGVRDDFSRRHTAHFVPTPPAILRKIPPIKLINIPNALIQSSQNKCINPFTPQLLVTLLIHNAFSIHYGYTWMFSLLKILDRHRTTTNRHDRLPTSPQLLSFDIVCAD